MTLPPELYEFMQTKLFGLIYAILIAVMMGWSLYNWGHEKGRMDERKKHKVLFIAMTPDGKVIAIDDEGKTYNVFRKEESRT